MLIITKTATTMPRSAPSTASTFAAEWPNTDLLTISVQDFGPIAQAKVNLRPLTIFVGRSNTGKTYFSKLVYAIHKTLFGFPEIPFIGPRYDSYRYNESLDSILSTIRNHPKSKNFQQNVRNIIFNPIKLNLNANKERILHGVGTCFGTTDILTTRRAHSEASEFKLKVAHRKRSAETWSVSIGEKRSIPSVAAKFDSREIELSGFIYKNLISEIRRNRSFASPDGDDEFLGWIYSEFGSLIKNLAYPDSGNHQDCYFLPANRGGILESHKFIADAWLAQMPNLGLPHLSDLQPMPKVSVDFIRTMLMAQDRSRSFLQEPAIGSTGSCEKIAKLMEDELIDGKLQISPPTETAYPEFRYLPSHAKLSLKLDLASSMVSELAPIIVTVRSYLNPYDLLIIEEPEAHLNPGALPLVAKCLAMLVRNNVRVLITTHSDWLLKSLRNLILEGDLVQLNSDQNSTDDDYLLRQEVGAWEFSAGDDFGGTTVSEIEFDELDGIEPSEIERISDDLYNESVAIRNAKARRQQ